jgi:hypothetical protein
MDARGHGHRWIAGIDSQIQLSRVAGLRIIYKETIKTIKKNEQKS